MFLSISFSFLIHHFLISCGGNFIKSDTNHQSFISVHNIYGSKFSIICEPVDVTILHLTACHKSANQYFSTHSLPNTFSIVIYAHTIVFQAQFQPIIITNL